MPEYELEQFCELTAILCRIQATSFRSGHAARDGGALLGRRQGAMAQTGAYRASSTAGRPAVEICMFATWVFRSIAIVFSSARLLEQLVVLGQLLPSRKMGMLLGLSPALLNPRKALHRRGSAFLSRRREHVPEQLADAVQLRPSWLVEVTGDVAAVRDPQFLDITGIRCREPARSGELVREVVAHLILGDRPAPAANAFGS